MLPVSCATKTARFMLRWWNTGVPKVNGPPPLLCGSSHGSSRGLPALKDLLIHKEIINNQAHSPDKLPRVNARSDFFKTLHEFTIYSIFNQFLGVSLYVNIERDLVRLFLITIINLVDRVWLDVSYLRCSDEIRGMILK